MTSAGIEERERISLARESAVCASVYCAASTAMWAWFSSTLTRSPGRAFAFSLHDGHETHELRAHVVDAAAVAEHVGQQQPRVDRLRVVGTEATRPLFDRLPRRGLGRLEIPKADEARTDDREELDAQVGPAVADAIDFLFRFLQQLDRRDGPPCPPYGSASVKMPAMKSLTSSARCFSAIRHGGLAHGNRATREHRHENGGRRADGESVARDELPQPIGARIGPRADRAAVDPALDVLGERVHRRVSLVLRLLERLQDDRVEIAAKRRTPGQLRHRTRARRIRVADRFFQRAAESRRSVYGARRPPAR